MVKIVVFIVTVISCISLGSCKKGYTCSCSSTNGFYDGFDIHESKKKAEKKCDNYYISNYENQVVNDSLSNVGTVKCELQKGE